MKKPYENPFFMKLDISGPNPLEDSSKCDKIEWNTFRGNKKDGLGCYHVTVAYSDNDGEITWL